jgi:N-sulfoglucosamine sulfohydrolase
MHRYGFLVCFFRCAAVAVVTAAAALAAGTDRRPNILLLVGEDVGLQLGCYGDGIARTPQLDQLAAQGIRYERAYVTQSVCSPSRASLLTGLYPHQHGQIGLATHQFTTVQRWPNLPAILKTAGYRTGRLGKLHILPEADFPFDFVWDDSRHISFRSREVFETARVAQRFIESGGPFFLMVNFADAHTPFLRESHGVPANPIGPQDAVMPAAVGINTERLRTHAANYYNSVERLDTGVGLVLDALEQAGLADNTVVLFLGDHGPQFSRGKTTCYELALRVPLILRLPARERAIAVRRELVSIVDVLPTLLELTQLEKPARLAGSSILPGDLDRSLGARRHLFAEWNTSHPFPGPSLFFPQRSVRDERYKLIVTLLPGGANPVERYYTSQALLDVGPSQAEIDGAPASIAAAYATWREAPPFELYDLHADPDELVNVADRPELAAVRERLFNELTRWRRETNDPLLDAAKLAKIAQEDRERAEYLRQHGREGAPPWRYPVYLYDAPAK